MADRAELEGFNEIRYATSGYTLESTAEKERIAKCVSLLKASKPSKILDVGCSDGIISEVLKRETGAYLIGMDASAAALEKSRLICDEVHRVEFGTQAIPLPDACVDGIFAGEVIEHVFYTEAFLEELLRVAKPGCRMAISTPNLSSWYNRIFVLLGLQPLFTETGVRTSSSGNWLTKPNLPAGHIRNFTLSSLKHLLKTCGWEVEESHGIALLGNKWRSLDRFFSSLSPAIAADLILLCRRP
jgi:2-polyprenyl-3-methyl-5-hydroxy-6-metoxy-1,4-benzoquinol methylase